MSTETKPRIKQILRDCCAGNASLATDILHDTFVIIDRQDLPRAVVNAEGNVEVAGVSHSVWPASRATATRAHQDALEYLAAAYAIEVSLPDPIDVRRDELARELVNDGAYAYRFAEDPLKLAIDRIIELEAAK